MADIYLFRRKTAADWTSQNPVLLEGELGLETDTGKFKFGNGSTTWTGRPYAGASVGVVPWGAITGTLSAQTDLQAALNAKQATLVSGTNIKTVNGNSLMGSGDLVLSASAAWGAITGTLSAQTDLQAALNLKANTSSLAAIATSGSASDLSAGALPAARFDDTAHGARAGGTLHADATTIAAGFMSGADKTKLDAITGTNTGDQTITLTGDVTGSGSGSFAATIANLAVTSAKIADDAVGNDKLANMAQGTIKGRATAGTGDPEDLTGTQATALLDVFTSGAKGLAPASGGGTTNFLRADGTWAAPPGGGGGISAVVDDPSPELGGNLDALGFNISGIDDLTATGTLLLGTTPSALRKVNVAGSGFDCRLSLQGLGTSDAPGLEMTINGNTSRALMRMNAVGGSFDGTELEFQTQAIGGGISSVAKFTSDGHLNMLTTGQITNLAAPSGANDAARKADVDLKVNTADLSEAIDDRVAALVVAGTNMTITYNDGAGTLTFDAAGGGAGTNLSYTAATRVIASDTGTDATLPLVTSGDAGLAPASGGGTANFLRADGTWAAPPGGGGGSPGGSSGEVQFNSGGAFAGAADVEIEGGQLRLPAIATPATPAAGGVKIFGRDVAGRILPAIVGPSGLDTALQPFFGRNRMGLVLPPGNGTAVNQIGFTITATGTATSASVSTSNLHTYMRRLEFLVTTATPIAVVGIRNNALQWTLGAPSAGNGGFHLVLRWGPATGAATATHRAFAGMRGSVAAPTDVDPSTLTNICGMGYDAADTNIQFLYNDASGTATKVNLGASFPKPTATRSDAYEIALFAPPGTTQSLSYEVRNLGTGAVATGTVTTDLPSTSTLLSPYAYMSVGGTSSVIGLSLMSLYIETDY